MNQERLKEILTESVIYLYPSLKISDEIEVNTMKYASLKNDGSIDVKGDLHSLTGYNISTSQNFLPNDELLLSNYIEEINTIFSYTSLKQEYLDTLINTALNSAISSTLSNKSQYIISRVMNALDLFSERTYEGKKISYGVVINDRLNSTNRVDNIYFDDYINNAYSAVLTNGTDSFIEIDTDGYLIRYLPLDAEKSDLGLAPYNYTKILEYCGNDSVGIVLSEKGELLIFHNNELKYTKRGNSWNPYSHKEIIKTIYDRSENDNMLFSKTLYLTALDVSFAGSGGIISFLDENEVKNALKHISISDIINKKYFEMKRDLMRESGDILYDTIKDYTFEEFLRKPENNKACVLNRLIGDKKFFMLNRKLREELVGIDGATIIDYNGDIVSLGSIIKIEAGSVGGGRLAAAQTLSLYGISIEISADSSIKGFSIGKSGLFETIFNIS